MSLVAIKDIDEGEEITVNYNYDLDTSPNWYKKAHKGTKMATFYRSLNN